MGVRIRRFQRKDLVTVQELVDEGIEFSYTCVYSEEAVKFFKKYHCAENILKDAEKGFTVILEFAGCAVATGTLLGNNIRRVFVKPSHQRQGLGKKIMRHLEKQAVKKGSSAVVLQSSINAKGFYDGLGYETLKKTFIDLDNNQRLDYFEMAKKVVMQGFL